MPSTGLHAAALKGLAAWIYGYFFQGHDIPAKNGESQKKAD